MPKVSVIIPTYNSSQYICEAIDSVLAQTYRDVEIIIIDDGSRDNTKFLLERYSSQIRYIYQENKGAAAARNKGILEAQGEYLAFLDADDLWLPEKLNSQVEAMISNPEVAIVFTDDELFGKSRTIRFSMAHTQFFPEKGTFKYKVSEKSINDGSQIKDVFYKDLLLGDFICTSTVLANKDYLKNTGSFNEDLSIAEDYDLWLRMARLYPFLYLNTVTTRYRIVAEGLSGAIGIREYRYCEWDGRMLEIHLPHASAEHVPLIKKRIWETYKIAAWGYLNIDLKKTRQLSILSLIYNKFQVKSYLYILASFLPINLINLIKKVKLLYAKN